MTVVWTEEMKAKAAETRRINKEKKAERLRKKEERLSRSGNGEGENAPSHQSSQEDISRMDDIQAGITSVNECNPASTGKTLPFRKPSKKPQT